MKTIQITDAEQRLLIKALDLAQVSSESCPEAVFCKRDLEEMEDPDNPQRDPLWSVLHNKLFWPNIPGLNV